MTDPLTARLRADRSLRGGRKVPQHLYLQLGDEPDDADPSIGRARTSEIAAMAVAAVNDGQRPSGARWWCSGGLVYIGPAALLTADWVIALDDPEMARRIVAAARGEVPDV